MRTSRTSSIDRTLRDAREIAFGPHEFMGQEGFAGAAEVLALARAAGIGPDSRVLDLCCGTGGPGLLLTRELGCTYTGIDARAGAIEEARAEASRTGTPARLLTGRVPPLPQGTFDVVLLLEALLAFRDRAALFDGVVNALAGKGRFALTTVTGEPLSPAERTLMPDAETVWLTPVDSLLTELRAAGLRARYVCETTDAHARAVARLLHAYAAVPTEAPDAAEAATHLLRGHRLWWQWMRSGRVRTFAVVAGHGCVPRRLLRDCVGVGFGWGLLCGGQGVWGVWWACGLAWGLRRTGLGPWWGPGGLFLVV